MLEAAAILERIDQCIRELEGDPGRGGGVHADDLGQWPGCRAAGHDRPVVPPGLRREARQNRISFTLSSGDEDAGRSQAIGRFGHLCDFNQ